MKIKFFKKEKKFKKERLHLSPYLIWQLSIFAVFIVAIFSSLRGYYLFMQISKETFPLGNEKNGQFNTVKKERIDKVLEYFSTREQKSNQILNSPAPVIDPSF